jgi:competence protein ComEC
MRLFRFGTNPRSPARRSFIMSLRTVGAFLGCLIAVPAGAHSSSRSERNALQIYIVDVEGGQATLFVTPAGESLLIDAGWAGNDGRDADRIMAAAKSAGISAIDFVLITHFHTDHVGGVPQLAARIPVKTFIDHGENRESADTTTVQAWLAYQKLLSSGKYKRIIAKPGQVLPIQGLQATVVSSDGDVLQGALAGAGQPNPACGDERYSIDQTENARSLGILITFGKLRALDLGDLTRDREMALMCPVNKLGKIDIYIVSHHGSYQSGSPALVYGVVPRVAIMDNGARKGGSPSAWDILRKSPGLEDLWQLHYSDEGGPMQNVASEFIANPRGADSANHLKVTAWDDGTFEMFNSRTHMKKRYPPR